MEAATDEAELPVCLASVSAQMTGQLEWTGSTG